MTAMVLISQMIRHRSADLILKSLKTFNSTFGH